MKFIFNKILNTKNKIATFFVNCNVDVTHIRNGKILNHSKTHNLVVNQGLNYIKSMIGDSGTNRIRYIALSNNTTTPITSDLTTIPDDIYTEFGLERSLGSYDSTGIGSFTVTKQFTCTSGPRLVRTIGIYTESTGNTLFAGTLLSADQILQTDDIINIIWTITLTNAT